ncbi:THUMP domain-containing protein [Streptomyces sp. NPDC051784]|uniref:THUMP domain-containing protein n=1 Tax=Streptomyces sp. NPDC051784 TaxID=3155805 RepID=UPI003440EABC
MQTFAEPFAVRARRRDTSFPLTSSQMEAHVGARIKEEPPGLAVNLERPEVLLKTGRAAATEGGGASIRLRRDGGGAAGAGPGDGARGRPGAGGSRCTAPAPESGRPLASPVAGAPR